MKRIVLDPTKCDGCRVCEAVCSLIHEGEINPAKSRIKVVRKVEKQILYSIPVYCRQCEEAYCKAICPANALSRNGEGTVIVDEEKCIGCKLCEAVCPVGAITIHPEKRVATKCDLCNGLAEGPQCVKYCFPQTIQLISGERVGVALARARADKFLEMEKKGA